MTTRSSSYRLTAILALVLASALASPPAQAGCVEAVRGLLGRIAGGHAAPREAEAIFADLAADAELKYVDRLGQAHQVKFRSYAHESGRLVLVDAAGHEVETSLGNFLSTVKDGTITVDGTKAVVKSDGLASSFAHYDQTTAALTARGVTVTSGAEADAILSAEFKKFIGAHKAVYDPRTKRLLVGSRATLDDFLNEVRRAEIWTNFPAGGDVALSDLALSLGHSGSAVGMVSPETDEVMRAARALASDRIAARESLVTDWHDARDATKETRKTFEAVDAAFAKIKKSDPRREEIGAALAKLKERATASDAALTAKYPVPNIAVGSLARFDGHSKALIAPELKNEVKALAAKYGVESVNDKEYYDLVERVFQKLAKGGNAVASAEKMADFGMELDKLLVNVSDEGQRAVRYSVAEAVNTLEEFRAEDYVKEPLAKLQARRPNYVHVSQYPEYIKAYINKTPPYTALTYNGFDVLTIGDIRDAAVHNMWPILIDGHDVRHVHYALGHPRAAAAYFMTARSQSQLRYVMEGALYEGVDLTQYTHEAALCKYMSTVMHMDLEQAMVYVAKAPVSELERIAKASGAESDIMGFVERLKNWHPKETAEFRPGGQSGSLTTDLDREVADFDEFKRNPENAKYTNYARSPGAEGAATQDDSIHFRN